MKKRLLTFVLVFCILVGFSSCASSRADSFEKRESINNEIAGMVLPEKTDGDTDYDEYDLVILRYYAGAPTSIVADELTEELGWKIKIVTYDQGDKYKLTTKLLAGDDDFDLYIDASVDFSGYMQNGFYTDLKQFEGLKERMSSNRLVDFAAGFNVEYIGLPMNLVYNPEGRFQNQSPTVLDYSAKNLDSLEKRFSDPDGEKFYEVLRYVYDNNGDIKDDDYREYLDFTIVTCSYCIMSPSSKHKDNAALFLERMYDAMVNLPDDPYYQQYPEHYPLYPDIGDADLSNAYLFWRFSDQRGPIIDAYLAALESDGSDQTLRKLAKEAASQVKLRMME